MKILGIIIALAMVFALVGCENDQPPVLPTATGLRFDGVDARVLLPQGSQPTGAFTLAIRCKPDSWDHAPFPSLIGGRGVASYGPGLSGIAITRAYHEGTATDRLYFDVADGSNEERRVMFVPIADIAPVGQWSFIVLTNTGAAEDEGLKLWRDAAQPIAATTGAQAVRWVDDFVALGHGGRDYYRGLIGEVLLYGRVLSEAEITALYNGQAATGGLRGWWKLDEGTGDTARDSSGNNNHGTLEGGAVWFTDGD